MSHKTAFEKLPDMFWITWRRYWKNQIEGACPLVLVRRLVDSDMVFGAPLPYDKLQQVFNGLADDDNFILFAIGDWVYPRDRLYGHWSLFRVSVRHNFLDAVRRYDDKHQPVEVGADGVD